MRQQIKIVLILIFLLINTAGLLSLGYVSINGSLTFLGNADTASAVSPVLPGCGITIPFFLSPELYLKASLSFSGTNYMYNGTKPVPAEIEHREYLVLMPEAECFFGFSLPVSKQLEWGAGAGLTFVFWLPVALFDTVITNYNAVTNWFYQNMRFLYPGTEIFLKWNIEADFGMLFSVKGLFPVFHLWDNAGMPFWDQLLVTGSIGVFFPFPEKK